MATIEGFKLYFDTKDLKAMLLKRAEYHASRAATKEAELPKLRASLQTVRELPEELEVAAKFATSSYNNQDNLAKDLEGQIRDHKRKTVAFRFYAQHLAAEGTYVLGAEEVARYELIVDL